MTQSWSSEDTNLGIRLNGPKYQILPLFLPTPSSLFCRCWLTTIYCTHSQREHYINARCIYQSAVVQPLGYPKQEDDAMQYLE